jgi:hypothetical protein
MADADELRALDAATDMIFPLPEPPRQTTPWCRRALKTYDMARHWSGARHGLLRVRSGPPQASTILPYEHTGNFIIVPAVGPNAPDRP